MESDEPSRVGRPRICLIIGQLGLGGTEKQLVLLADGLRRRGAAVTVVVLTGPGPREGALRAAGVPVVHLGLRQPNRWLAIALAGVAFGRLTRLLRQWRPDLVHAFLFHSYLMAVPAAKLARVPVLVAGRRSLDDYKRGWRLLLRLERAATALTGHLVANADAVAECVRVGEQVPAEKITTIYNGLPPEAFAPVEPATVESTRPVVLCVANLKDGKGHQDLIAAAALLAGQDRPCTLVLVGDGPLRTQLAVQAAELGVDARLLGARTDVTALLARCDVAVSASHTEGMSNAVMEAMAAGRPVVATAVGGTPELLAGDRGLLVPPGDPISLAHALATLLSDPDKAARLAEAALAFARTELTVASMVDQHVALYRRLLAHACAG